MDDPQPTGKPAAKRRPADAESIADSSIDERDFIARLTRLAVRWRLLIGVIWLGLAAAGVAAGAGLGDLLSNRFEIPGSETAAVEDLLEEEYGLLSSGVMTLALASDHEAGKPLRDDALLAAAQAAGQRAVDAVPEGTAEPATLLGRDLAVVRIETPLDQADLKGHIGDVRTSIGEVPGATRYVTGAAAFEADMQPVLNEDLKRGELYFAVPIALAILVVVFASLGFLLPWIFAAAVIPATLAIVWLVAHEMVLSTYILNMVVGIGLGISIDYSLLIHYRYQEELRRTGATREEAVVRTMRTAGRTVIFSGTVVAVGLAVLLFMPLPFMRGFGVAGLLIPAVSVLAAVTLMPGLIYSLGHRLERFHFMTAGWRRRRWDDERSGWARLARAIMQRPWPWFATSAAVLLALAAPVLDLRLTPGSSAGYPEHLESAAGVAELERVLGEGAITPMEIVVDAGEDHRIRPGDEVARAATRLRESIATDPAAAFLLPHTPDSLSDDGRYLRITVTPRAEYGEPESSAFAERVRNEHVPRAGFPSNSTALVGGTPAAGVDLIEATYGAFPWVVAAVLALSYLVLLRAFRSLWLPLKAILLNLLSIAAAYGLLVLVFTTNLANAVGLQSHDQVAFWVPVFMFAMLFGLSMDYEVFLVSRMREEWDRSHDNRAAVALGLARTGRIVTAAGLIMVAAFGGFMASSPVEFQQFGFGLSSAILIDVTLVRAVLLPSFMAIMGRWNWYLPHWARRFASHP